ncbi:inverse autotransporter beta domain-containing protein [Pelagibacterales bacterium]|nr:inverse autotransporter beta domain-containing protein [Pelagibacterales bacterium]
MNLKLKNIIPAVFLLFTSTLFADEVSDLANKAVTKSLDKIGSAITEFIPGEGDTEITITSQDTYNLKYSILAVRPVAMNPFKTIENNHLLFTQFSLSNTEPFANGDDRIVLNTGLGLRTLVQDGNAIFGANIFYDHEFEQEHQRASFGLEYLTPSFEAYANLYERLSDSTIYAVSATTNATETVVNGYDVSVVGQLPYMPWGKIVYKTYNWDTSGKDTKGKRYNLEARLSSNMILELGRNDQDGLANEDFGSIMFRWPSGNDTPTIITHTYTDNMFAQKDMSNEMLHKVRRTNSIVTERQSGGLIITRGN